MVPWRRPGACLQSASFAIFIESKFLLIWRAATSILKMRSYSPFHPEPCRDRNYFGVFSSASWETPPVLCVFLTLRFRNIGATHSFSFFITLSSLPLAFFPSFFLPSFYVLLFCPCVMLCFLSHLFVSFVPFALLISGVWLSQVRPFIISRLFLSFSLSVSFLHHWIRCNIRPILQV